jgi:hypothetical protein
VEEHLHAVAFDEEGVVVISPLALHPALRLPVLWYRGGFPRARLPCLAHWSQRSLGRAGPGAWGWARWRFKARLSLRCTTHCKWAGERETKKKVARRLSLQLYFNYYMTHSTDRHNPDVPAVNGYGVCGPDTALRTRGHRGTLEERKHLSSTQRLITGGSLESAPLICSRPCRTAVVAVPCTLTCAAAVA